MKMHDNYFVIRISNVSMLFFFFSKTDLFLSNQALLEEWITTRTFKGKCLVQVIIAYSSLLSKKLMGCYFNQLIRVLCDYPESVQYPL